MDYVCDFWDIEYIINSESTYKMDYHKEEIMKVRHKQKSRGLITNIGLNYFVFLLLGCFNNLSTVSTSVINGQTELLPSQNFQSDQGYTKGTILD